jgi:hypothetical protein
MRRAGGHGVAFVGRSASTLLLFICVGVASCSTGATQPGDGLPGNTSGGSSGSGGTTTDPGSDSGGLANGDSADATSNPATQGPGGEGGAPRPEAGSTVFDAGGKVHDASSDGSPSPGLTPDPPCLNGKKDGTETGVDCGGSCGACPNYQINPPNANNGDQSACTGGNGYMCPRSMLFSSEMKQAAMADWNSADPPFVYGTVGHDPDLGGVDTNSNTCCQCYQLVFDTPQGASGLPIPKPMIVQAFNTQAGGAKNFDVYMGDGGYGANNACAGVSNAMYSQFPDQGGTYAGGVKATRYSQCASGGGYSALSIGSATCESYVQSQCDMILSSSSAAQTTTQASCIESNLPDSEYHTNWSVLAKRVTCPANLTRVTGCKLNDQGLPAASPNVQDRTSADSSFKSGYTTTSMQDCCRPTCAWPGNVTNTDSTYSVFYTCDKSGNPLTN